MQHSPPNPPGTNVGWSISVVICTYTEKRWPLLERSVASIETQSLRPLETIVVVDNNPALYERAKAAFPSVQIVLHEGQRGAAGARNTAVRGARGDLLAFIDDDSHADPEWLARLAGWYEDPEVATVGGAILPTWHSTPPSWFPEEFLWVVGCTYRGLPLTASEVRNLIAANMSVRRDVFEALGGFNEDLGRIGGNALGCEETELCIRARQQLGAKVIYDPAAMVWQYVPPERANWRYFFKRCFAEGLSKANVVRLVGQRDGLASERGYAVRTLSAGMAEGVGDFLRLRDVGGLSRAAAIGSGFGVTALGYARATLALRMGQRQ